MQSRVADLIERVQDEIILESTLQINDELNSVFVRYERSECSCTPVVSPHYSLLAPVGTWVTGRLYSSLTSRAWPQWSNLRLTPKLREVWLLPT